MSNSRAARRRASRRRHPSTPTNPPLSVDVVLLGGDTCPICELFGLSVHDDVAVSDNDGPSYSEEPEACDLGPFFDQTPDSSRSDLPWEA
jgi:hypothetical protein